MFGHNSSVGHFPAFSFCLQNMHFMPVRKSRFSVKQIWGRVRHTRAYLGTHLQRRMGRVLERCWESQRTVMWVWSLRERLGGCLSGGRAVLGSLQGQWAKRQPVRGARAPQEDCVSPPYHPAASVPGREHLWEAWPPREHGSGLQGAASALVGWLCSPLAEVWEAHFQGHHNRCFPKCGAHTTESTCDDFRQYVELFSIKIILFIVLLNSG